MMVRLRAILPIAALFTSATLTSCSSTGDDPIGPPTVVPDIAPEPVEAAFSLEVDAASTSLSRATLDPSADAVRVSGGAGAPISLRAFAKRVPHRPEIIWVDVVVESALPVSLRDVALTARGAPLMDLTRDPFATERTERVVVGGLGAEGVSLVSIGIVDEGKPVRLELQLVGIKTKRVATMSAPLALAPDGAELWVASADADALHVVDTRTDAVVATVPVCSRPTNVAVTPDGASVLATCAAANEVVVVDRASRAVTARLGEADGIGREPRHVVVTPDGGRAFVSAYVGDVVTTLVRNGGRFRVERTTPVGRRPTGMAVTPDGKGLIVAHFLPRGVVTKNEAWITTLSPDGATAPREITIHDHFNLEDARCIADVFGISPERMTLEGVATQLWGVFLPPGGGKALVPGARAAGSAIAWERGAGSDPSLTNLADVKPAELLPPFVFLFDARDGSDVDRAIAPGGVERDTSPQYLRCARFQSELEWVTRDLVPSQPGKQANRFLAFPSGMSGLTESGVIRQVAFTRGGRRALFLAHSADEIVVGDAATFQPSTQRHFALSGSNPVGIAVTPDGRKAYVSYESSPFVSVVDTSAYAADGALPTPSYVPYAYEEVKDIPQVGVAFGAKVLTRVVRDVPDRPALRETAQIKLFDDRMDPELRRGKVLFASANPDKYPVSANRLGACASCHPDGSTDGSMWGTMEGERRTMSLRGGVGGRGWLHAQGTHIDALEFAEVIGAERLGGTLGAADARALARYVAWGIPKLQAPATDRARVERGRAVFARACAGCHEGERTTSGNASSDSPWGGGSEKGPGLYDVGTATDDARVILAPFFESLFNPAEAAVLRAIRGDRDLGARDPVQKALDFRARPERKRAEFKAPSLTNVWDNAIFFHDGRYDRIEDAVHHIVTNLRLPLSPEDERDVVEYLRTM
jgi:YVTN family beta-propeller protein